MALPKNTKKIIPDINKAVQRAAETSATSGKYPNSTGNIVAVNKGGRPSPRTGNTHRQTLLLSEKTAERLTMAYAGEQIQRRKKGLKLDKSLFIEEMMISWLDNNGY